LIVQDIFRKPALIGGKTRGGKPQKYRGFAMKNKLFFGMIVCTALAIGLIVAGCASVQPMSNEAIRKYALVSHPENFKNFQYYVSRDIVLTYVSSKAQSTAVGQIDINRDIIQILSSTPGVVLDVKTDINGNNMLGVAFELNNDSLLWFVQNPAKAGTYFYLAYTDESTQEIEYGGYLYSVSYEQATGIFAFLKRLLTPKKTKEGEYENMEPILLYEERVRESEQRRNLQGRRL
jgi:hypothetical protein